MTTDDIKAIKETVQAIYCFGLVWIAALAAQSFTGKLSAFWFTFSVLLFLMVLASKL